MPRFSTRTLALVRRNVDEMLVETCSIQRETGVKGTMGENLHTLTTVATGVLCRLIRVGQRSRSQTMQVGSQESLVEMYRLITPRATLFEVDDQVTMSDGRVFQVVDVEDGLSDEAFARVVVTRVR